MQKHVQKSKMIKDAEDYKHMQNKYDEAQKHSKESTASFY